jgi:regulator of cell morphogenesis and NO signaling
MRHVALDVVCHDLEACDAQPVDHSQQDWQQAGPTALIEHIRQTHHISLRQEIPRLRTLMHRVIAARPVPPRWLRELLEVITALSNHLRCHLLEEDHRLFPQIIRPADHAVTIHDSIERMTHEHEQIDETLERIRWLTADYQPPADASPQLVELFDGLRRVEADLHRLMHKENNILFPLALGQNIETHEELSQ